MIRARSHKKWYTVTNRVVYTKEDKELYNKARMEVMEMAALWLVGDFGGTQKDYSTSPWICPATVTQHLPIFFLPILASKAHKRQNDRFKPRNGCFAGFH